MDGGWERDEVGRGQRVDRENGIKRQNSSSLRVDLVGSSTCRGSTVSHLKSVGGDCLRPHYSRLVIREIAERASGYKREGERERDRGTRTGGQGGRTGHGNFFNFLSSASVGPVRYCFNR